MGQDLARDDGSIRELYERADDAIGAHLTRLCWEGPEDELRATENAQPALLLHSFAVWMLIRDTVGTVTVGAGHSLGELSAHLVAGTFEFDEAIRIVRRRGELMAESGARRPGTMTAVLNLDLAVVEDICTEVSDAGDMGVVVPANLNAPGQIVVSGDRTAVEAAGELAASAGARRVLPLNVSGAFHSPLMEVTAEGLDEALADASLADPRFPIISNATAEAVEDAETAHRTLVAQLTSPVRWIEGVERIRTAGPARWFEVGAGRVLAGLVRRIDRDVAVTSVGDSESVNALMGVPS